MAWVEVLGKRLANGKVFADGNKRAFFSSKSPLHYEGTLDSGIADTQINAAPTYVNNAQLDGWVVTQNNWHYALGQPADKQTDGWVGFGGRQGQNWVKFRLARVGYLHYPTRAWDDIGGTPTYNRSDLSAQLETIVVPPTGQVVNILSKATWRNIWETPNGGSVYAEWLVSGDRLKENVVVDQLARTWITANRPPTTNVKQTYFGLVFQLDVSDVPKWIKNGILQNIEDDFDDADGQIEIKDSLDRLLGFMPLDYLQVDFGDKPTPLVHEKAGAPLRKRIWKDPDGNYYLLVGVRCDALPNLYAGDLIFDPTWGATNIQVNTDDGNDHATAWYVNGEAVSYDYVSEDGDDDQNAGYSWTLPEVPDGSTIDSAYFRAYDNTHTGTMHAQLKIEDSDPASAVIWSSSHLPNAATFLWASSEVTMPDVGDNRYYFGPGDEEEALITDGVQDLLDKYGGFASGDRMNIGIMNGPTSGTAYMGFNDYNKGSNRAQLYLEWTEGVTDIIVTPTAISAICSRVNPAVILGTLSLSMSAISAVAGSVVPVIVMASLTLSPAAISAICGKGDPSVVLGSITFTPTAITALGSKVDPSVIESSITFTPTAITAVTGTTNPVTILGSVTLTPEAISALTSVVNPNVVISGDVVITPSAISAITSKTEPTVVLGTLNLTPSAITALTGVVDPDVVLASVTITPTAISAIAGVVNPYVIEGGDVFITPTAISAVGSKVDPTVLLGSISITPSGIAVITSKTDPTVVLGSISLSPTGISATGATIDPTVKITGDMLISPTAISAITSLQNPTVVLGSVSITPQGIGAVGSKTDPTVVLGSVTLTMSAISALASTTNPSTVMGSLTISPDGIVAITSKQDPTVILGTIQFTPSAISAVSSRVNPVVVMSSITISDITPLSVIAAMTDPTVIVTVAETIFHIVSVVSNLRTQIEVDSYLKSVIELVSNLPIQINVESEVN